jgi:hypothetical protein
MLILAAKVAAMMAEIPVITSSVLQSMKRWASALSRWSLSWEPRGRVAKAAVASGARFL